MKQVIITPNDLRTFMTFKKYFDFISYLRFTNKIPQKEPIRIIAKWNKRNGEDK